MIDDDATMPEDGAGATQELNAGAAAEAGAAETAEELDGPVPAAARSPAGKPARGGGKAARGPGRKPAKGAAATEPEADDE